MALKRKIEAGAHVKGSQLRSVGIELVVVEVRKLLCFHVLANVRGREATSASIMLYEQKHLRMA